MCLEVHIDFGVLAGNFVSFNNYFSYRQTRPTSLDILTTSYHDGIWLCTCSDLTIMNHIVDFLSSLLHTRVILK